MELKSYQQKVMNDLSAYLHFLNRDNDLFAAWKSYWAEKDIGVGMGGVPAYQNAISGVPHVCMKVPTGGGKTFMACAALRRIFDEMPLEKPRVAVWLVPSDSILSQTIRNLSNPDHEYRLRLNTDFAGQVGVYTKEMLLNGQNFSPDTVRDQLTVCVLSYGSMRIDSRKKDVRKVYQENGNLLQFARYFGNDEVLLADTPETALIQVLRRLAPVVVVDESHNAGSDLSVEMLNNLNPSFVLDLTATPRKNSNIISYVDARELKKENMVKLPVVVFNRNSRQDVIKDALQMRANIERQALNEEQAGGAYIRPIVLFQAQPKTGEDSDTFEKIKAMLVDMGVPKEQIAIKTSKVDELGGRNLMSRDCPIRFIITVNALKEGWDCPFAYILASLANKTSTVDVEQILGRILRQPYARQHSAPLLNTSYVFTCSNDFLGTVEHIVKGLNAAGFSRRDFRTADPEPLKPEQGERPGQPVQTNFDTVPDIQPAAELLDTFADVRPEEIRAALEQERETESTEISVIEMEQMAVRQAEAYRTAAKESADMGFIGGELGEMLHQYEIQPQFREQASALRIPQFFFKTVPDLFGGEYVLLKAKNLSDSFSLAGQDAQISFELATGEMVEVDVAAQGEAVPKYRRASKELNEYIRQQVARMPQAEKQESCVRQICMQLNKNNQYAAPEIEAYVRRVVNGMTEDELAAMETAVPTYARRIAEKIAALEQAYRAEQFRKGLDSGKIVCRPSYALPSVITPAQMIDSVPLSLYEAERSDMNAGERGLLDMIAGMENVLWWHRIIERKDFCINGGINHYPDFMVMTKRGLLVLVEFKGDDRDNSDSKAKLQLGRQWQACAGQEQYRYFMVFKNRDFGLDGAYTVEEFAEVLREL